MKKRVLSVILAGCMAITMFGCSTAPAGTATSTAASKAASTAAASTAVSAAASTAGSTAASTTPASTAASTAAASTAGSTAAGADDSTLKMVSYFPAAHPYYDEVQKGVKAFAKDTGVNVDIQIGADWNQSTETERVEALVAQGVNAISIYPSDASGANGLYDDITKQGCNVVNFGADVNHPSSSSFTVATDCKEAAYAATKALIDMMGGKGNIINVLEVLEDSNTAKRKEGVEQAVAENPNVKIIQEVSGIGSEEEAVTKIGDAVSANNGQVNGIICTGANPSVGLVSVLKDYYSKQPDAQHIYGITIDTDPTVTAAIKDGTLDATIAQNPYGHGYISCMILKYMHEGYKVKSADKYFVNSGYVVVKKDNLDTYTQDLDKVTKDILGKLTTDYLTK